ncbi:HAMP domain-containing sensor histidine kinase [Clostridium sp. UBA5119]|uniref:sensor histidine kinase n=1 Tax=Clostridium sp. UBA5119 TaxID=1946366 RepID=UPI0032169B64
MIYITILFGGIAALFIVLFLLNRYNISNINKELKKLKNIKTNEQLKLAAPNKNIEEMIGEINFILEKSQNDRIAHEKSESELRKQIANISHDLRTPLTSILGYVQLIKDKSTSEEEKQEYLDIIEKRSKVLQNLITSFYDLSRLEANEYDLEFKKVNVESLLREIVAAFYNDFIDKDFKVEVDLQEKLPAIIADENAVIRIFTNIFQNALKHGNKTMSICQRQVDGLIISTFSNRVENFTQEDLEHVFDRFFTADRMRTGQNTGLGLTIVKKLTESMGHEVSASLEDEVFTIQVRFKLNS